MKCLFFSAGFYITDFKILAAQGGKMYACRKSLGFTKQRSPRNKNSTWTSFLSLLFWLLLSEQFISHLHKLVTFKWFYIQMCYSRGQEREMKNNMPTKLSFLVRSNIQALSYCDLDTNWIATFYNEFQYCFQIGKNGVGTGNLCL